MVTGHSNGIYECTAPGDTLSGRLNISFVRWVGATAADHRAVVKEKDINGAIFFPSEADGANFLDVMAIRRWMNGFYVETLDSGKLYIYTV